MTQKIIGVFYEVYNEFGHGFLESVYEAAFEVRLHRKGLPVSRQIEVPVWFRGKKIGDFTADMLVDKCVLLNLKLVEHLILRMKRSCLIIFALLRSKSDMLFSFGLKPEFKRLAFDNSRKQASNVQVCWKRCFQLMSMHKEPSIAISLREV